LCSWREQLVGDGCEVCNPALALEYAKQTIEDLRAEVEALRTGFERLVLLYESEQEQDLCVRPAWVRDLLPPNAGDNRAPGTI
jgi:hypothetical protein